MEFFRPSIHDQPLYQAVNGAYRMDESRHVVRLLKEVVFPETMRNRIQDRARKLVEGVRQRGVHGGIDGLMQEYDLSNQEGIVLMCLAEALLRVPDAETADELIADKMLSGDWKQHKGHSESLFVNASTWGLMLTGRIIDMKDSQGTLKRLLNRSGEPMIRQAMVQAMRVMGRQFVMGRTIKEGLKRSRKDVEKGYRHSFDMLGEGAKTMADADRYLQAYQMAIEAIGKESAGRGPFDGPGISIKLSALHPRYELAQGDRVMKELLPRLQDLARQAKAADIGMTIDAEEAYRLDISMELLQATFKDPALKGWEGLGLALQTYQKRAFALFDWLADLSRSQNRRMMVRLVKGAYWDMEIKLSQELGLEGFPVFTRKASTDVSYLACARKVLAAGDAFFPQFATHNAHTVAAILEMAGKNDDFEFQRLHGMGEALHDQVVAEKIPVRIYAPVGKHEDLLAYLVRRLLENGANSSFVNRIVNESIPIDDIIADPIGQISQLTKLPHPQISLPENIYGRDRRNSQGLDLANVNVLESLAGGMKEAKDYAWKAVPLAGGVVGQGAETPVMSPADRHRQVGTVVEARSEDVVHALNTAHRMQVHWDNESADERAACLERAADLMEQDMGRLIGLLCLEGGKSITDGISEVREAVDFCRYYAVQARKDFGEPQLLPGPTGERNTLRLHGRGTFVCISPWNFPLAIFTGQVVAALVAGNAVIAKPAEQTPLIAAAAVDILHRAGVPKEILHYLPGDGSVGAKLVADDRIAGVAFTGSTETAWAINKTLAAKRGPIVPLIAETGGQNCMIVDSSALPEQVIRDVVFSSFQSAGQRCSALRVLFIQTDIADKVLEMLTGAMKELRVGDPWTYSNDIGPVIDEDARKILQAHAERMDKEARLIYRCELPKGTENGTFFAPCAYEIDSLQQLEREVFGPVLHVIRYRASELDSVIEAINGTGYGLTFGMHSRIDNTVRYVTERMHVGNAYVNRNMIGAVVGVQPFGGEGLSGTGFKAGGPRYLYRFAGEQTLCVDTTAAGGNASLMSLQ